jgi:CPA1 family monovalent cation:H+ antiporter
VLYRFALAALITGVFSFAQATLAFIWVCVGGVGIGLLVAWLYTQIERRLDDSPIEITLSFLVPFAAYIPAEASGASGVLAAVAAGLYVGRKSARIISPASRVQAEAVWGVLTFILNGLAFILIGLQLRGLITLVGEQQITLGELLVYGALVSLVVILVRLLWVFPGAYLPYYLFPSIRAREPLPRLRSVCVLGWMGMRGVVSLAAALALPLTLASGQAFHERPLIVLLTYCVILATLVGQGLTLPELMRRLHVGTDGAEEREEEVARLTSARAALQRIDELTQEKWATEEEVSYLRAIHEHRTHRYDGNGDVEEAQRDSAQDEVSRRLKREVLQAERQAVIRLRDEGAIGDGVLRRLERELDLQDLWLEG